MRLVCNAKRPLHDGMVSISGSHPQVCRGSKQVPTHEAVTKRSRLSGFCRTEWHKQLLFV